MNTTSNVVGPVLVFTGMIAIIAFFARRQHRSSWQGSVVERVHVPGDNDGAQEQFYITCQTDAGKRIKVSLVGRAMLDGYKLGQRVEKKPGQSWPGVLP